MPKNCLAGNAVISDASCLIGLTNIGRLEILWKLCDSVMISREVAEEYGEPLPEWIAVHEVTDRNLVAAIFEKLDLGESASIALALKTEDALVILDDLRARKYAESANYIITKAGATHKTPAQVVGDMVRERIARDTIAATA